MFSLIITIVSILLVAALALATFHYGGSAFSRGDTEVRVLKVLNEGQQLIGAADLFKADRGVYPSSINQLVSAGYLKSIPTVQTIVGVAQAQADSTDWTMPKAGIPVFIKDVSSIDICRSINKLSYGQDGILSDIRSQHPTQCWGTKTGEVITKMQVVFSKSSQSLTGAADTLSAAVSDQAIPSALAAGEWILPPGITSANSSNNGGETGAPEDNPPTGGDSEGPDLPPPSPDLPTPPPNDVANVYVGVNSWCSPGTWWDDPNIPGTSRGQGYFALRIEPDAWYQQALQSNGLSVEVQTAFGTFVDIDELSGSRAYVLEPPAPGDKGYIIGEISAYSPVPAAQMYGPGYGLLSRDPNTPFTVRLIPRSGQQKTATIQVYCRDDDMLPGITSITHDW